MIILVLGDAITYLVNHSTWCIVEVDISYFIIKPSPAFGIGEVRSAEDSRARGLGKRARLDVQVVVADPTTTAGR